ncbi:aminotransferase class IV [Nonlabens spongiae]|uniref:branched-chain-amino-acid transaminase n=1 Tax=Nonlabens spongiae TaxID=331648 RepID=A0A1W6MI63_9FLAO|nr:aminotransferase class IV [Nonlabens spongiae]ARN77283.1 aminotransferase class IV [Nonlabens spongiae]
MINLNGSIVDQQQAQIPFNNRGTYYGDGVFETLRCYEGKPLLFEAHYFRLMASMRILRMEIPQSFTPEFIEEEITNLLAKNNFTQGHARVRFTVWRKPGGFYTPQDRNVEFAIESSEIDGKYQNPSSREVELFKDHHVVSGMLGNLKTAQKMVNILAGIYAQENDYQDMLLINEKKMVVESISGNLFLRSGDTIKTPPLSDGCLNGIMREQVLSQLKMMLNYKVEETTITPFELQRADELFTTNMIRGVQSIHKYRKKAYETTCADELIELINGRYFGA